MQDIMMFWLWPKLPNSEGCNPEYEPTGADEKEDEVPVPDHQEHFVIDHVEAQHAQGVLLLLPTPRAVPSLID